MDEPDQVVIRTIESAAADALNPAVEIDVDGWRFRTDPSGTRRGNSVFPEHDGVGPLRARLRTIEEMYRARGATPRFQVTSASRPTATLDVLVGLGWTVAPGADVCVRRCDLTDAGRWDRLDRSAEVAWEAVDDARSGITRWRVSVHASGLGVVASGAAVVDHDRGWVGLFSLDTQPAWRGRGFGTTLVGAILAQAHEAGVGSAYLQVDARNDRARRLYDRLGFRKHHAYHYVERL